MVLWVGRVLAIDFQVGNYHPHWSRLPLQFSLALGPLIYFYVLRLTRPDYKIRPDELLHFSPVLLQLSVQFLPAESQLNAVLQLLTFISVVAYLCLSHRLIESFYQRLKFIGGDRYRTELRWLHRLLVIFAVLWLLWIPYAALNYFGYHNQLGLHTFYPLHLFLAITMIWIGATAFLRPELELPVALSPVLKSSASTELRQKGTWLKKAMEEKQLYQDPELSLSSLAEKLEIHTHELSRIINIALKKNFNDFVNEYRVRDVARKMQDPAYDRITLLGMAYDAGFNSKATFIRAFKQLTGKNPAAYKHELEKEVSTYHLQPRFQTRQIILVPEAPKWPHEQLNYNYMFRNYLKSPFGVFGNASSLLL